MKPEIGTAETIAEEQKRRRPLPLNTGEGLKSGGRRRGGGGGGGDNNGGGNGGSGGGGNNPDYRNLQPTEEEFRPDKLRIVMWFLLLVVVMTFGGLISAYMVIATNGVLEWQPFNLPGQIWVSTLLILASSATYQIANNKLQSDHQTGAKKWLLATTVLGATFVSSQLLAWLALAQKGVYLKSNPYAGFFYILTAVHAAHVIGGIVALGYLLLRSWNETSSENELLRRRTTGKVVGWYWHFMGGLWIVLFLLLALWK